MNSSTSSLYIPAGYSPKSTGTLTPTGTRYYWGDWGSDIFDYWGNFYIFNPADQTASAIGFSQVNQADGTITTETQTHHSKTIKKQFKMEPTSSKLF